MEVWADKARRTWERCGVLARALKHPRTPWYAKAVGALTLLYAISPIDLIPDFVPVLGYLDDIVLVPLGIWATWKLVPRDVWAECEAESARAGPIQLSKNWRGAVLVILLWLTLLAVGLAILRFLLQRYRYPHPVKS